MLHSACWKPWMNSHLCMPGVGTLDFTPHFKTAAVQEGCSPSCSIGTGTFSFGLAQTRKNMILKQIRVAQGNFLRWMRENEQWLTDRSRTELRSRTPKEAYEAIIQDIPGHPKINIETRVFPNPSSPTGSQASPSPWVMPLATAHSSLEFPGLGANQQRFQGNWN
jgi:hypothetical protein